MSTSTRRGSGAGGGAERPKSVAPRPPAAPSPPPPPPHPAIGAAVPAADGWALVGSSITTLTLAVPQRCDSRAAYHHPPAADAWYPDAPAAAGGALLQLDDDLTGASLPPPPPPHLQPPPPPPPSPSLDASRLLAGVSSSLLALQAPPRTSGRALSTLSGSADVPAEVEAQLRSASFSQLVQLAKTLSSSATERMPQRPAAAAAGRAARALSGPAAARAAQAQPATAGQPQEQQAAIVNAVLHRIVVRMKEASPEDLDALLALNASTLRSHDAALVDAVVRRAHAIVGSIRPRRLLSMVESLAAVGSHQQAFLQAAAGALAGSVLLFSPSELARVSTVFAALRHHHGELAAAVTQALTPQVAQLSAREQRFLLSSQAPIGASDTPLVAALCAALPQGLFQLTPPERCRLVHDLATAVGPGRVEQLLDAVAWATDDAALAACSVEDLCHLVSGMAALRHRHDALLQRVALRLLQLLRPLLQPAAGSVPAEQQQQQRQRQRQQAGAAPALLEAAGTEVRQRALRNYAQAAAPHAQQLPAPQTLCRLASGLSDLGVPFPDVFDAIERAAARSLTLSRSACSAHSTTATGTNAAAVAWTPQQLCHLLSSFATAQHYAPVLLAAALPVIGAHDRRQRDHTGGGDGGRDAAASEPLGSKELVHLCAAYVQATERRQQQQFAALLAAPDLLGDARRQWYKQMHSHNYPARLLLRQVEKLAFRLGHAVYRNCRSNDTWFVAEQVIDVGAAMVAVDVAQPEDLSANRPQRPLGRLQYRSRSLALRDWVPCQLPAHELEGVVAALGGASGQRAAMAWLQEKLSAAVAMHQAQQRAAAASVGLPPPSDDGNEAAGTGQPAGLMWPAKAAALDGSSMQ